MATADAPNRGEKRPADDGERERAMDTAPPNDPDGNQRGDGHATV